MNANAYLPTVDAVGQDRCSAARYAVTAPKPVEARALHGAIPAK